MGEKKNRDEKKIISICKQIHKFIKGFRTQIRQKWQIDLTIWSIFHITVTWIGGHSSLNQRLKVFEVNFAKMPRFFFVFYIKKAYSGNAL